MKIQDDESMQRVCLSAAWLHGIHFTVHISEFVHQDRALVLKINDSLYRIVAGKKLTPDQAMQVMSDFWEAEWIRRQRGLEQGQVREVTTPLFEP